jgi:hypothetical protein
MQSHLPEIIRARRQQLHAQWMEELTSGLFADSRISKAELSEQTDEFLRVLGAASS